MKKNHKIILLFLLVTAVLLSPLALNVSFGDDTFQTTKNIVEQPTSTELISDIENAINSWKTLGVLAGLIAILQLLVKLLKLKIINDWMVKKKIKWIKPYIAVFIGIVLGVLTSYSSGVNLPNSILAGLLIGVASTGWNEILNKTNPEKRKE